MSSRANRDGVRLTAASGLSRPLRFLDFYPDADEESQNRLGETNKSLETTKRPEASETAETQETSEAAKRQGAIKTTEQQGTNETSVLRTLEKAADDLQQIQLGAKSESSPMESPRSSTRGTCDFCGQQGFVLMCSRCKEASYCHKQCQRSHFKVHKEACKRAELFDKVVNRIPAAILTQLPGGFKISHFLADLQEEFSYRMLGPSGTAVLVEIVGPYFHLFRYGVVVKDRAGQTTHILFYNKSNIYLHVTSVRPLPLDLSVCVQPGNFILLLNTHWHYFLDLTKGIRIDDLADVHFIFPDQPF